MVTHLNFINQGQGIPFVFQHGLSANILQAQKLFGVLPDIQLISVDCPGHGQSLYPVDPSPSFDYYAEQVIKVLDHLNLEKVVLGGLSMGSGIALNIALRFPKRVRALVLLRPAWLDQTSPDNLTLLLEAAPLMKKQDGQLQFQQKQELQKIRNILPAAADSIMGVFDKNQQAELDQVLKRLVNDRPFDQLDQLKNIQQPTIIIANEDDPLHPFSMAETIHQFLPNSKLHKVVSRYLDNEQHGEAVRKLVGNYLAKFLMK